MKTIYPIGMAILRPKTNLCDLYALFCVTHFEKRALNRHHLNLKWNNSAKSDPFNTFSSNFGHVDKICPTRLCSKSKLRTFKLTSRIYSKPFTNTFSTLWCISKELMLVGQTNLYYSNQREVNPRVNKFLLVSSCLSSAQTYSSLLCSKALPAVRHKTLECRQKQLLYIL